MSNHHSHAHSRHGTENLSVAFFLNLGFTLVEFVGGWLTNSVAIFSDAMHDLGDSLSLGLAWYLERKSGQRANDQFSFGYRRFSLLGALVNATVLLLGSTLILVEAVPRLWSPEMPATGGMIGLAVLGVLVNGFAVLRLRRDESLNAATVRTHLLEDVWGWMAVLIGAVLMHLADWPWLDPLLSIGIAGWVLWQAQRNLRKSLQIFLQGVPPNQDLAALQSKIANLDDVASIHDLHLWSLDGERNIFTVHLKAAENLRLDEASALKQRVMEVLHDAGIEHITIQIEAPDEPCDQDEGRFDFSRYDT